MLLLLSAASAAARAPGPRDGRGSPALSPPPPKRPEGGGVLVDEALGETLADLSPPCPPRLPPTTAKTRLQEKKRWLERGEWTTEGPIEGGWLSWLPKSAINPFLILYSGRRQRQRPTVRQPNDDEGDRHRQGKRSAHFLNSRV